MAANERDVLAEALPVQLDQAGAMAGLLHDHLLEKFRGGGILSAQPLGEIAINAGVLFFERNCQRQNLAPREIFELFGHSREGKQSASKMKHLAGSDKFYFEHR